MSAVYAEAVYTHPESEEILPCYLCYEEDKQLLTVLDDDKKPLTLEDGYTDFPYTDKESWNNILEVLPAYGLDVSTLLFG